MVLPYDSLELKFLVRNVGDLSVEGVEFDFSENPDPQRNSDVIRFSQFTGRINKEIPKGGSYPLYCTLRIEGTTNPKIMEHIVDVQGDQTLPILNTIIAKIEYAGKSDSFMLTPSDENGNPLAIQYPDFKNIAENPPPDDICAYYQRGGGDSDFHHPYNTAVRKLAIEASIGSSGVFPDTLDMIVYNIYNHIKDRFVDEPNLPYVDNDIDVATRALSDTQCCITQAYLLT